MLSVRCLTLTTTLAIASSTAYAQSPQEVSNPTAARRVASSLERHKAVLSSLFAPSRVALQGDDEDSSAPSVDSPQWASPVEFDNQRSLALEGGYFLSSKSGRDLEIGEWSLGYRANQKLSFWAARQAIAAKGRTRPVRPTFNADADRYGLRYLISGTERKGVTVQYDRYATGEGFATDNAGSSASLPSVKTDIFNVVYHFRRTSEYQDAPALPGYRLRLNYANVHGSGAGAAEYGFGAGATFKIARNLYGDGDATGYMEARRGNSSATNFRLHLNGGLTFQPAKWVKLQAGLDVYPGGVPLGGTAITSLSGFGVYQRNDGVSGISSGTVAVLNVRLVVGKRF